LLAVAFAMAGSPAGAAQLPNYSAGLIAPNGTIDAGSGFTVTHTGTGQYVISYPTSTGFTSFPVITVTPVGYNGHITFAVVAALSGSNGSASFTVNILDSLNKQKFVDNGFAFTLMET
jgi:hypothetical protein